VTKCKKRLEGRKVDKKVNDEKAKDNVDEHWKNEKGRQPIAAPLTVALM